MNIIIESARIYDPEQHPDGRTGDIGISHGRIVSPDILSRVDRVIDGTDLIAMPAALDPGAIVSPFEVLALRQRYGFPSPVTIGKRYAERGYAHIHQPFLTIPTALSIHQELRRIPFVDISVSLALPVYDLADYLDQDNRQDMKAILHELSGHLGTWGLFLAEADLHYRLDVYQHKNRPADVVLPVFGEISKELNCLLSVPAINFPSECFELATEGIHLHRVHDLISEGRNTGKIQPSPNITVDLGLPWREPMLTQSWQAIPALDNEFSCDVGFYKTVTWNLQPGKDFCDNPAWVQWLNGESSKHAALTTAYANLAMIEDWQGFLEALLGMWSLEQWIRATRTCPAAILRMPDRGHLKEGARADVALFSTPTEDTPEAWANVLSHCHTLLLGGQLVIVDHHFCQPYRRGKLWRHVTDMGHGEELSCLETGTSLRLETIERMLDFPEERA